MATHQFVVLTNAKPGAEAEFDRWYDEQHLVDVVAVPGVVRASRFRVVDAQVMGDAPSFYSVALYEIDAENPKAVIAEINARAGTDAMPIADAVDMGAVLQLLSVPAGSVERTG